MQKSAGRFFCHDGKAVGSRDVNKEELIPMGKRIDDLDFKPWLGALKVSNQERAGIEKRIKTLLRHCPNLEAESHSWNEIMHISEMLAD